MIYDNVKAHCQRLGITIMECEKRAGLGNAVIGGWRHSTPRLDSIIAVAKVLGVDVNDLIKGCDGEYESCCKNTSTLSQTSTTGKSM